MRRKIRDENRRRQLARRDRIRTGMVRSDRPRLTVYRSAKHIYAQIVDPESGRTLASASTRTQGAGDEEGRTGNVAAARKVGATIAKLAREREIERVVFNRNGFLYHGRVKALAEAAREAGLQF